MTRSSEPPAGILPNPPKPSRAPISLQLRDRVRSFACLAMQFHNWWSKNTIKTTAKSFGYPKDKRRKERVPGGDGQEKAPVTTCRAKASAPGTPPTLALRATKSPNRERLGLRVWWARRDLNPGPKDYAYHYGFRRLWRVCGLDYTFPLQAGRLVSTPSPALLAGAWLGIGVARRPQLPPNLTSSTRHQRVAADGQPMKPATHLTMSRLASLSPLL